MECYDLDIGSVAFGYNAMSIRLLWVETWGRGEQPCCSVRGGCSRQYCSILGRKYRSLQGGCSRQYCSVLGRNSRSIWGRCEQPCCSVRGGCSRQYCPILGRQYRSEIESNRVRSPIPDTGFRNGHHLPSAVVRNCR